MEKDQNTLLPSEENIYWTYTKIALKFWWRHFFVIPIIPILLLAFVRLDLTAVLASIFAIMFFAIFDDLKCNYKKRNPIDINSCLRFENVSLQERDYWNATLGGTPAYANNVSLQK
ncbi:hypothetical protein [Candidatus Odyssella acanthamoebae]|uniref:Uncharacterized protein n=1 Tax=Candidatus Odyssella acanthamoebae TaxID=91604 RepID=A0A077AUE3_9PROT|nr:hypothetical protein [Candidatus Paracaedibacter acanthamoebae]AIK95654.1 hypothetical protein ID47_01215 [Candidatus Paracaedibacter acanthamoebae]